MSVTGNDIVKVNFNDQQLLVADDLNTEQDYHSFMRRLNAGIYFTEGIVKGLEVDLQDQLNIIIKKGFALVQAGKFQDIPVYHEIYLAVDTEICFENEPFQLDVIAGDAVIDLFLYVYYNEKKEFIDYVKGDKPVFIIEEPVFTLSRPDDKSCLVLARLNCSCSSIVNNDGTSGYKVNIINSVENNIEERKYSNFCRELCDINRMVFKKLQSIEEQVPGNSPYIQGSSKNGSCINITAPEISNMSAEIQADVLINGKLTINGTSRINGNFEVTGNSLETQYTYIGTELEIKDSIIELNNPGDTGKNLHYISGIEIYTEEQINNQVSFKDIDPANINDLILPAVLYNKNDRKWFIKSKNDARTGDLAFGLEELKNSGNADHLHFHGVLCYEQAEKKTAIEITDDNKVKAGDFTGISLSLFDLEKLTINGSIKASGIKFSSDNGEELTGQIIQTSCLVSDVFIPTGDPSIDTSNLQNLIGSDKTILITHSDLVLTKPIMIGDAGEIHNLAIICAPGYSISLDTRQSERYLFNLYGNCSGINIDGIYIGTKNTGLLSIEDNLDEPVKDISIRNCCAEYENANETGANELLSGNNAEIENLSIINNNWQLKAESYFVNLTDSKINNIRIIKNNVSVQNELETTNTTAISIIMKDNNMIYSPGITIEDNIFNNLHNSIIINSNKKYFNVNIVNNKFYITDFSENIIDISLDTSDNRTSNKIHLLKILDNIIEDKTITEKSRLAFRLKNIGSAVISNNRLFMNANDAGFELIDSENINITNNLFLNLDIEYPVTGRNIVFYGNITKNYP